MSLSGFGLSAQQKSQPRKPVPPTLVLKTPITLVLVLQQIQRELYNPCQSLDFPVVPLRIRNREVNVSYFKPKKNETQMLGESVGERFKGSQDGRSNGDPWWLVHQRERGSAIRPHAGHCHIMTCSN